MTLLGRVKKLYEDNHKVGELNEVSYDYTCPSRPMYSHQWIWDSCFHSIVLSHFDIDRAKKEIKTLLSSQKENGFIPCCTLWHKNFPFEEIFYRTKITQPPVLAIAVEIIYQKSKDINFAKDVYPKLKKYMDWLTLNRDTDNNGLIEVIHPWETGIDSTPTFDGQLGIKNLHPSFAEFIVRYYQIFYLKKKFKSQNVLMNSIYAKALKSMSNLAKLIGGREDAKEFEVRYKTTLDALIKYCWNETDQIFYDLDQKSDQVKIKTVSSLMPLILDDLPKKYVDALVIHLTSKKEFWSDYPIPSVSMDEKTFSPGGGFVLWRGPTWINTNWFLSKALIQHGFKKEAKEITEKTLKIIEISGFREYYNPFTGEGYGQPNFGWSTLILDMIH